MIRTTGLAPVLRQFFVKRSFAFLRRASDTNDTKSMGGRHRGDSERKYGGLRAQNDPGKRRVRPEVGPQLRLHYRNQRFLTRLPTHETGSN